MLGCLLEGAVHLLFDVILRLLVFPLLAVLATPFILVGGIFGPDSYRENVRNGYRRLARLWSRYVL